jgi:hypothetical protein
MALSISELTDGARAAVDCQIMCGQASSSRLTPAAIRPNERRERAFRAAANAVSAATVTPGASPRAFSAAFSRSSASLSLRGLLSAMRQSIGQFVFLFLPPKKSANFEFKPTSSALRRVRPKSAVPLGLNCACAQRRRGEADGSRPASSGHSTAPFASECQSFLDNFIAGLGVCSQTGRVDYAAGGLEFCPLTAKTGVRVP